mgnify:CR=1 FL=1
MHKVKALSFGCENFNISLNELKENLNFDLIISNDNLDLKSANNYDVLLCHENILKSSSMLKIVENCSTIKILATNKKNKIPAFFEEKILMPLTLKDINTLIENTVAKKNFFNNSSIKIKDYILDKNEKKVSKKDKFIILTEKEIQLLELLSNNTKSINKKKILEEVWKYASDADTHTVETHIHRLRKKIKSEFKDEGFILNNKDGYLF